MADNASKSTAAKADKVETITIPINPNLSAEDREALIRALAPPDPLYGVVGNYADVQRGGGLVVKGEGTMDDGVETPVSENPETDQANSQAVNQAIDKALDQADKVSNS